MGMLTFCGYQTSTGAWQTWQDVEEFYALLEHSCEAERARNLVWEWKPYPRSGAHPRVKCLLVLIFTELDPSHPHLPTVQSIIWRWWSRFLFSFGPFSLQLWHRGWGHLIWEFSTSGRQFSVWNKCAVLQCFSFPSYQKRRLLLLSPQCSKPKKVRFCRVKGLFRLEGTYKITEFKC